MVAITLDLISKLRNPPFPTFSILTAITSYLLHKAVCFDGPIAHLVPDLQKIEVDGYKELDDFLVEKMTKGRCCKTHPNTLKQVVLKYRKKDPVEKARLRQISDNALGNELNIQVLWHDNTPVDLDSVEAAAARLYMCPLPMHGVFADIYVRYGRRASSSEGW